MRHGRLTAALAAVALLTACRSEPLLPSSASERPDSAGTLTTSTTAALECETSGDRYAKAVVGSWLPTCSLERNAYSDPSQALGPPDAVNLGGKDNYRGLVSLGQGGYVTLDMGRCVRNGPGDDLRIYQATSSEEVSVYVSAVAGGPFVLVDYRRPCGSRSPGLFSNHCDFDLAASGVSEARYVRVEDGEIYPCLSAGTVSEGADLDAVEILN
jgi:hypothetical protein